VEDTECVFDEEGTEYSNSSDGDPGTDVNVAAWEVDAADGQPQDLGFDASAADEGESLTPAIIASRKWFVGQIIARVDQRLKAKASRMMERVRSGCMANNAHLNWNTGLLTAMATMNSADAAAASGALRTFNGSLTELEAAEKEYRARVPHPTDSQATQLVSRPGGAAPVPTPPTSRPPPVPAPARTQLAATQVVSNEGSVVIDLCDSSSSSVTNDESQSQEDARVLIFPATRRVPTLLPAAPASQREVNRDGSTLLPPASRGMSGTVSQARTQRRAERKMQEKQLEEREVRKKGAALKKEKRATPESSAATPPKKKKAASKRSK
jgi:hypothetical protein